MALNRSWPSLKQWAKQVSVLGVPPHELPDLPPPSPAMSSSTHALPNPSEEESPSEPDASEADEYTNVCDVFPCQ